MGGGASGQGPMMEAIIDRPIATAIVYLAVLALGVFSYLNTPLELAPKEDFPQLDIVASWPGVPPGIILTRVTAPLEEAVIAVRGVRKVTSASETGNSRITVELDPQADPRFIHLALREEIAKVGRILPYGVRPSLEPYVPDDFKVRPFLSFTVSAAMSLPRLRETVKDKLEFGLGSVPGVARVEVTGGSDPELRVVLDRKKLMTYDIQPMEVHSALNRRLKVLPAGTVRKGGQEFNLRVFGGLSEPGELGETVVAHTGGNILRVRDLARIDKAYGESRAINRLNGQPTVSLTIYKEKGTNTLKTAAAVKKKLAAIRRELPRDLTFKKADDESLEIRRKLKDLTLLAGTITAVVFLMVLLVLRSLGPSLLILSSIACSVVITFNIIYVFGISMNMMTLGALALGFGMFVDNSIVVFENILRLRERGVPPRQAAIQGSREVFTAVLASTLTTVSVFLCFPYFQGRLRIYYLPLAIVMVAALSASLLVSCTLIPSLSRPLIKPTREARTGRPGGGFERSLDRVIRRPIKVLLAVGAIFFGSAGWFMKEVPAGEFPNWYSKERLSIIIGLPPGTDLEKTDGVIRKFEAKVLEADCAKEMITYISPERAQATITFPPEIERSSRPYALKEQLIELAAQFAGIDCGIYGFDPQGFYSSLGSGTPYGSSIKFYGYNLKKLKEITSELARTLLRNPRIKDFRIVSSRRGSRATDSFEYVIKIDKEALGNYDVSPTDLYFHLRSLVRGSLGAPLQATVGGREIALPIKFPEAELIDIKGLQDSLFKTAGGDYLRLGDVSRIEERPIAGSIDRENQQYQQTLSWEFRGPSKAAENYKRTLSASLRLPPGFSATPDEPWRVTTEESSEIKSAAIFSLIFIFMILAALYESFIQPFFIMLAVPLGLIGVFLAFIVTGASFDASAYIGVILLGGIVVNNAILLVDHINLKRRQGLALLEAVLKGTQERVRPILMTTSTTIFGLLPMLFITTEAGRREVWSSLALCTAGGLVSSTALILIVVPVFYFYGDRLKLRFEGKIAEARAARRS
jgi:hydrophobic/amphiphilic exporter-1 (mainly G- bacteria), HAE1 family